ncbi:MAG TPA: molybdenum cofactor guanylyltransferase [Vicinamibacterales bacterium]
MDAAILAGGQARRFGGVDKSTLSVGRVSIFERQLAVLDGLADRVFVVAGEPARFEGYRVRVVPDRLPDAGALGGIYTALCEAEGPHVLIIACDLPFLSGRLLARLVALAGDAYDAVVPRAADGLQPLCAVYARRLTGRVRRRVESGHLKIQDLLGAIRVRELGPGEIAALDPDGRLFFNVNTPDDFDQAVRLAARTNQHADR